MSIGYVRQDYAHAPFSFVFDFYDFSLSFVLQPAVSAPKHFPGRLHLFRNCSEPEEMHRFTAGSGIAAFFILLLI